MKRIMIWLLTLVLIVSCIPAVPAAAETARPRRYTVLILDVCGTSKFYWYGSLIYTADSAVEDVRTAADRFLDNIELADGDNQVCVITFARDAELLSGFTSDFDGLRGKVDRIVERDNSRNITSALEMAEEQFAAIDDPDAIRNIVIYTTGHNNQGPYSDDGPYNNGTVASTWHNMDTNIHLWRYCNSAILEANLLKDRGITIYSIGLFNPFDMMPERGKEVVSFFRLFARDLASDENCFFDVYDTEALEFAFGTVSQVVSERLVRLNFLYQDDEGIFEETCYYTDMYFDVPANEYQPSLATMSISLAMASFGSYEQGYTDMWSNARKLMVGMGVDESVVRGSEGFNVRPGRDSIGAVAGWKKIHDGAETLIIVGVRGGGYESEWASNFKVGASGRFHQGFKEGADQVLGFLKDYIRDQKITGPVKLWITGYSRAAAVSNLVGGLIDEGENLGSGITFTPVTDVYVYCFETPRGVILRGGEAGESYRNIHSIVNPNDPVPKVAPLYWKFGVFGLRHELPTPETDGPHYWEKEEAMLNIYSNMQSIRGKAAKKGVDPSEIYLVDDFRMKKLEKGKLLLLAYSPLAERLLEGFQSIMEFFTGEDWGSGFINNDSNRMSQSAFLDSFMPKIVKEVFGTRSNYQSKHQDAVREVAGSLLGMNSEEREYVLSGTHMLELVIADALLFIRYGSSSLGNGFRKAAISSMLQGWMEEAGFRGGNARGLISSLEHLIGAMLPCMAAHINESITMAANLEAIGNAHYPQLCYAWLASADPNFGNYGKSVTTDGRYRVIRINCPVDVTVTDADGTVIARIVDDVPQARDDVSIVFGIDDDGQKYVYLPANSDFDVQVTASDDGAVSIGVSEYSRAEDDYTRTVSYNDIPVIRGDMLAVDLPAQTAEQEDTPFCTVTDGQQNEIPPTADSEKGAPVTVDVTAVSNYDRLGTVEGGGTVAAGSYVLLQANPAENCEFKEWTRDGKSVGTETSLRIRADQSMTVVANFKGSASICKKEGHHWEDGKCVVCGKKKPADHTWLIIGLSVLGIGGIAGACIAVRRKKRRKQPAQTDDSGEQQ